LATLALLAVMPQPWKGRLALHGYPHDLAHVAVFLAAFLINTSGRNNRTSVTLVALLLILFGALLEGAQMIIFRNPFEYHDVVSDAAGVALGLLVRSIGRHEHGYRRASFL
jgi:VanZ family protein